MKRTPFATHPFSLRLQSQTRLANQGATTVKALGVL
jgi:hypothetical protein